MQIKSLDKLSYDIFYPKKCRDRHRDAPSDKMAETSNERSLWCHIGTPFAFRIYGHIAG